jgi:hypothetical protein
MKKRWIMLLATVMLFAFTAGVVAAPAVQTITASLANDFKFTLNGEAWTPKDADGSTMAPIVYNDRTYLPARAIAEALGITVGWDADTRTVILGEAPAPVEEEPIEEEPVEEEPAPVEEEPVEEEPAPAAELAIEPATGEISKGNVADGSFVITFGDATKVDGVTAVANSTLTGPNYKLADPKEGEHYTITDNGDGTATFVIKKEIAGILPGGAATLGMVPAGSELVLTLSFDNGQELKYTYAVVD